MKPLIISLIVYLLLINALEFLLMHIDKKRAINDQWRIPEFNLLMLAVFGGSIGCIAGMRLFHHKTRHPEFSIGVPLILALQVILAIILITFL